MKTLFITSHGDLRPTKADTDEIRAFVNGENSAYERLVHLAMGVDGDITITPVTADEIRDIGIELDGQQSSLLRKALDDTAALMRLCRKTGGLSWPSLIVWVERSHPKAPEIVEEWATANDFEIKRASPPLDRKKWSPSWSVMLGYADIVRVIWPDVEVNTDKAIDEESAHVAAERDTAERELASIAEAF